MTDNAIGVRSPHRDEFGPWAVMFRAYRVFYELTADEAIVERVWTWIHDPDHETNALIATNDAGTMVGLTNYRRFARPLTGSVDMWLDDLFTDPNHRGSGIGRALIDAVSDISESNGCTLVRWITAADNLPGQRLYDSMATKTSWITYDRKSR